MSLAYGRPVPELQSQISSEHFTELLAFANRNTLSPDQWWSNAFAAAFVFTGITGSWVDPAFLVPGQVDADQLAKKREAAAERAMNRRSGDGGNR